MKLTSTLLLLVMTSCSTFKNAYKTEKLVDIGGITLSIFPSRYLTYSTNQKYNGTSGHVYGNTYAHEIRKDILKALKWSKSLGFKKVTVDKKINSYLMGAITTKFSREIDGSTHRDTFVLCFRNAKYSQIDDYKCSYANKKDLVLILSKLSKANVERTLKRLNERIKEEAKLE